MLTISWSLFYFVDWCYVIASKQFSKIIVWTFLRLAFGIEDTCILLTGSLTVFSIKSRNICRVGPMPSEENTVSCYLHWPTWAYWPTSSAVGFLVSSRSVINHLRNRPRPWFAAWSLHSITYTSYTYNYIYIYTYIYIYIHIQGVVQLCYPLLSLITNRDLHVEYHVPLGKLQLRMQGCCHHHKATTPMTQRQHHWRSYKLRLKRWKLELRWSVWDPDGSRFV